MSSPDLPPEAQTLGAGRPPLPPEAVLPAIVLRGLPGSVTATPPRAVIVESASVRAFPDRCGAGLPGRTTLLENLNAVSAGHLQRIVGLMCRDQESRQPGSFGTLTVDSTPARADMALVTDTHLVWSSADRLCGLLGRAAADGLLDPALPAEARGWLDGGPARRHRETVRGMLGDACRLALAAWEPVRGLAARRDGWRTEGAGPARWRALRRTADALERAPVGLVLCVRQARASPSSIADGEDAVGTSHASARRTSSPFVCPGADAPG